jgi:hypothetical protein
MTKMSDLYWGFQIATVRRAEEVYDRLKDVQSEAEAIEVMRGETFDVFRFIDEKPGYLDGNYGSEEHPGFMYLRRARNDRDSGLFDVLVSA